METLEKCGRMVFEIATHIDDFEAIKSGITLVSRLLQNFPFFFLEFQVQTELSSS